MTMVAVFMISVTATAEVIQRQKVGFKSHQKDCRRLMSDDPKTYQKKRKNFINLVIGQISELNMFSFIKEGLPSRKTACAPCMLRTPRNLVSVYTALQPRQRRTSTIVIESVGKKEKHKQLSKAAPSVIHLRTLKRKKRN